MSKEFWGIVIVICLVFLSIGGLTSRFHLQQVQELSGLQQVSIDRDQEIIALQKEYITDLETALDNMIKAATEEKL